MRLGDLDALKKSLNFVYDCSYIESKSKEGIVSDIIDEIDNAPTVKFSLMPADETKEDAYKRGYERGKVEGILKGNKRPQGKWVGNAFDEHHCNRCGHPALWEEEPDDYYEVQSDFCPNCGAEMQKGGAEE